MNKLVKFGLYLSLASMPYLTGCSKDIEENKKDMLDEFRADPKKYEAQIDSTINELYKLKIKANKGHFVKPDYVNPSDISFVYGKSGEGDYLMIRNGNTNELLGIMYVDGTTQLGDFKHRFRGLKREVTKKIFNGSESLLDKLDKIGGEGKNLLFILDNGGF
ncbi:MAG: hypothetical protein PHE43_01820 [Candidatus Nanoarchaeia archaeon]|nr:hypothetical protein [Candidatus Nanoarchaeia archaeon]